MKNKRLQTTYLIMLAILILGGCGLGAPGKTIPLIMCGASTAWFAVFFIVNRKRVFA